MNFRFPRFREKKNRKSKKAMRMDGAGSGDSSSSSSEDERDLDANLPTDEEMDRLEERLESTQSEQKNLFLIVFQR